MHQTLVFWGRLKSQGTISVGDFTVNPATESSRGVTAQWEADSTAQTQLLSKAQLQPEDLAPGYL